MRSRRRAPRSRRSAPGSTFADGRAFRTISEFFGGHRPSAKNFLEPRGGRLATTPTNLPLDTQLRSALTTARDQATLDDLARRINALYGKATLDVACAIGKLVVDELYDGRVDVWRREGTRRSSYRRLAAR